MIYNERLRRLVRRNAVSPQLRVPFGSECPHCFEANADRLHWLPDADGKFCADWVSCQTCSKEYQP